MMASITPVVGNEESVEPTLTVSHLEQALVTIETDEGLEDDANFVDEVGADADDLVDSGDQVDEDPDYQEDEDSEVDDYEDMEKEEQEEPSAFEMKELVYHDSATNVSYEIHRGSSKRGKDKLIDSLGFTYNCKPLKNPCKTTTWTCSVRNAKLRCPATVLQRGKIFLRGMKKHEHLLGQLFPKPDSNQKGKSYTKRKRPRDKKVRACHAGNKDYQLIKNGSKSGMDLLRDSLGYTYTYKRSTTDGYKIFWSCSVRNKHLRCSATIIQYGKGKFVEGPQEHQHLPAYNIPADATQEIPSLKKIREQHEDDDSDFGDEDIGTGGGDVKGEVGQDSSAPTVGQTTQSGSTYLHSGKSRGLKPKITLVKEKARRQHETFLGPLCTINLSKCEDEECNCDLVHCPFCDPLHFKPSKAGRVQDHLELTHFAHGVQYDDLMIVKCFKECDVEKTFGHYHCVFCPQQIIKREFYARHMLRHLRSMGIPERVLMLPDSKYPDIINAYGYEIHICTKSTCMPTEEKHFHCPCCSKVCRQRSLTVNHLWRCLQKDVGNTEDISDGDEAELCNTVDEDQIVLHISHVKTIEDLPITQCEEKDCCNQMYHCPMCPVDVFIPSYKQQLIVHYMTHWKTRVMYKNYGLMRCYLVCPGLPIPTKSKYHYHCPVCTKTIQSKPTFEEHLKSCHMLRFGENLIESSTPSVCAFVEDTNSTTDPAPLQKNIEFLEDQLIAQSKAYSKKKWLEQKLMKRKKNGRRMFNKPSMYRKADIKKEDKSGIKQETRKGMTVKEETEVVDTSLPIREEEIFDRCIAVLSARCMQTVHGRNDLKSMLGEVAGQTGTSLSLDDGKYLLTGTAINLQEAQALITKSINQEKDSDTEYIPDEKKPKKNFGRPTHMKDVKKASKTLSKKAVAVAMKRGRGRPRKNSEVNTETFPYSEIKEIINAAKARDETGVSPGKGGEKNTSGTKPARGRGRPPKLEAVKSPPPVQQKTPDTVKRGRGRPPKLTPDVTPRNGVERSNTETPVKSNTPRTGKKDVKESPVRSPSATTPAATTPDTTTPSRRYGTRGLRKDYAGMNSGTGIMDIKEEPVEETPYKKENRRPSNVLTPSRKRKTENEDSTVLSKKRKGSDVLDLSQEKSGDSEGEEYINDDDVGDDESLEQGTGDVCESGEKGVSENSEEDLMKEKQTISTNNDKSTDDSQTDDTKVLKVGSFKVFIPAMEKPSSDKKDKNSDGSKPTTGATNALKFKCTYCDKSFAYKSNLDDHENKHTGATPYQCEMCSKAFPSQSLLMKHKTLVHSTVRPFKCSVCHKSFRFMNVLQSHMATHSKPRSHMCKFCNKTYSTLSTLNFHIPRCPEQKVNKGASSNQALPVGNEEESLIVYTEPAPSNEPPANGTEMEVSVSKPAYEVQSTTEVETEPDNTGEVELYACSECNCAFDTYQKAEEHILTAHSVVS